MTPPLSPESRQQLQTLAETWHWRECGCHNCSMSRGVLALLSALAAQEAENERLRQENADADESLRLLRDLIADLRPSLAASTPEQET